MGGATQSASGRRGRGINAASISAGRALLAGYNQLLFLTFPHFIFIFYISSTFECKPFAMSAQPTDTKGIHEPEATKQADPSQETSDADHLREISAHWNSLNNLRPQPRGYHRGIHIPPNGPPGKFYIGYGTVVEPGLNSQAGIYV
jgi:hypothetical protein